MANKELASLNYAIRLPLYNVEKPYQVISDLPGTYTKSNVKFSPAPEPELIEDLRGSENLYGIDSHGFQIAHHRSAIQDWSNRQEIEDLYFLEMQQLIRSQLEDVDEVYIFNWRVWRAQRIPCKHTLKLRPDEEKRTI